MVGVAVAVATVAAPRLSGATKQRRLRSILASSLQSSQRRGEVVIVGAGLSGLAAARHLQQQGVGFKLLEASDDVGGRVRTDEHHGFLLDRGFQIFITAYPEAQRLLDYDSLQLSKFFAGALVRFDDKFHLVADPLRHLREGIGGVFNPIGTPLDKLLVGISRLRLVARSFEELLLDREETSIATALRLQGFSAQMIDRFFRPFLGGIFFDKELATTSRLFDFVFKSLAMGNNTLPCRGIGEIPKQLARSLPPDSISFNSRAVKLLKSSSRFSGVELEDGRRIEAGRGVVLAVDAPQAASLLKTVGVDLTVDIQQARRTVCLYFSSSKPAPIKGPLLLLNGSSRGIVNNMFFPSEVCRSYAPPGATLVSVSLVGSFDDQTNEALELAVRGELGQWFGTAEVNSWKHLRTYRIPFAQPGQAPPTNLRKPPAIAEGLYLCGDYRDHATFDGALVSGRRAAEQLLAKEMNLAKAG